MKKYGSMTAFIIVVFLIQINFFPSINLIRTSPNLLIIIIAGYGLAYGQKEGMAAGVIGGVLMDSIFGKIAGYYALPYLYIGFICGYFRKYLNNDNYIIPAVLCGLSDLFMGLYIFVFSFALRNRINLPFYMIQIIIPEMIYMIIISLILFRIQIIVNRKIDIWVKRRGSSIEKKINQ